MPQPEAPRICVWELTLRCNARCRLCGSSAGAARPDELSTAERADLARELVDLGLETVTLSGGEPLLADGFFDLARQLIAAGVRTDTVTNALAIDEDMASRLADLGLYGVTISFDGPEEIHDDLRGVQGCWRQAHRAMDALSRRGVRIGAITHVNRANLPHLERLRDALAASPVELWRLQLTLPAVGNEISRAAVLRPDELPQAMDLIVRTRRAGKLKCSGSHDIGYYGRDELHLRRWTGQGPMRWRGCAAGLHVLGLTADGGVYGCLSLVAHGDRFCEGHVRARSLTEIWRDPNAFAYNRRFAREQRGGTCGACRFLDDCRGGCINLLASLDPTMRENLLCLYAVEQRQTIPGPAPAPRQPSVVIFVADGVRPDFLGCCGGEARTPTIDSLAARGLLVRHARSVAAWTAPSIASLFTGRTPQRLGIVKWRQRWRAPADLFTLVAQRGYEVGSFPFDRRHLFEHLPQAGVAGVSWNVRGVSDWLVAHHTRPTLTYVHWWGTHFPYIDRSLSPKNWRRAAKLLTDTLNARREFAVKLRAMYRLAVEQLDRDVLPPIVQAIERGRGWDDTILVFTADHGECWAERYPAQRPVRDVFDLHGRALYEENLRVPLILAGAVEPGELPGPVALPDLAPTLARLCGAEAPADAFPQARDLFALPDPDRVLFAAADRDFLDAPVVPSDPREAFALFAALRGSQKLIKNLQTNEVEFYDLAADQGETVSLPQPPADLLAALEAEFAQAAPIEWDAAEDRAIRARLKALGYL
jgi:radical SAM protein with 4Fe4S-binding SPASM domain